MHRTAIALACALSLVFSAGAAFGAEEPPKAEPPKAAPQAAPSKVPTKPAKEPSRVAGSHIIIAFEGAMRAPEGLERTKEDAKKRAEEVLAEARKPEVAFEKAVEAYSDDEGSKSNGGRIGIFTRGMFRPEFKGLEDALFGMEIGQVSEIVESPYGFHILSRVAIIEYSASHILIVYAGLENADPDEKRTKEEAKKLADEILLEAKKEGADFAALAKEHSSCPSSERGGSLGIFGPGQMVEPFEKAVAAAKIGEIIGPVETPFGFHIIRRDKVELIRASHILIQYQGSMRAGPMVTRTKDQAKAAADEILAEVKKEGADFAALAMKHSEDPTAKAKGGDLGFFGRNQMHEAFDKAAFALKPGEIVGPVETPFGFHIIKRTE